MVKSVTMRKTVFVRRADGHKCHVAEADFDAATMTVVEPSSAPEVTAEPEPEPAEAGGQEAESSEDGGGEVALPADYDELNAGEVIALIAKLPLDGIKALEAREGEDKKRKTVLYAAASRITELEGAEDGA